MNQLTFQPTINQGKRSAKQEKDDLKLGKKENHTHNKSNK